MRPALAVGRTGFRLFRAGSEAALSVLERLTGLEFLQMLSEFVLAFESLWDGVARRAREVEQLLRRPECGFLLVVGPDPVQSRRAEEFLARLHGEGIQLAGVVLNRMREWPGGGDPPELGSDERAHLAVELERALPERAREIPAVADCVARFSELARRDQRSLRRWRESTAGEKTPLRSIPLFPGEVRALDTLDHVAAHLMSEPGHV